LSVAIVAADVPRLLGLPAHVLSGQLVAKSTNTKEEEEE
jgi:hypothetical protein